VEAIERREGMGLTKEAKIIGERAAGGISRTGDGVL
jgi:hypothetical protein